MLRETVSAVEFLKLIVCSSEVPKDTLKKLTLDLSDSTGNTKGISLSMLCCNAALGFLIVPNDRTGFEDWN